MVRDGMLSGPSAGVVFTLGAVEDDMVKAIDGASTSAKSEISSIRLLRTSHHCDKSLIVMPHGRDMCHSPCDHPSPVCQAKSSQYSHLHGFPTGTNPW